MLFFPYEPLETTNKITPNRFLKDGD